MAELDYDDSILDQKTLYFGSPESDVGPHDLVPEPIRKPDPNHDWFEHVYLFVFWTGFL